MDETSNNQNSEIITTNKFPDDSVYEYKTSVHEALTLINDKLNGALNENYCNLELLYEKIEMQTAFETLQPIEGDEHVEAFEFDEIKLNLKDNVSRILEKVENIEKLHNRIISQIMDVKSRKTIVKPLEEEIEEKNYSKFDRITIYKVASEQDLDCSSDWLKSPKLASDSNSIEPEICRRRAVENLNKRLIQQLEATDSLEGFLKLMARAPPSSNQGGGKPYLQRSKTMNNPNTNNNNKMVKSKEKMMQNKYPGSLWFFSDKQKNFRMKKRSGGGATPPPSPSPSSSPSSLSEKTIDNVGDNKKSRVLRRRTLSASTCPLLLPKVASASVRPRSASNTDDRHAHFTKSTSRPDYAKLKYYDLLDDLDIKDLKPIKSEYPRRDYCPQKTKKTNNYYDSYHDNGLSSVNNIPEEDEEGKENGKTVEEMDNDIDTNENKSRMCYLQKMIENDNETVWKKLFQSPRNATLPSIQRKIKEKHVKNLMRYLTKPQHLQQIYRQQNVVVMPVQVFYTNLMKAEEKEMVAQKGNEFEDKPQKENGKCREIQKAVNELKDQFNSLNERSYSFVTDLTRRKDKLPIIVENGGDQLSSPTSQKTPSPPQPAQGQSQGQSSNTIQKRRVMLEHLKTLKVRNDNLQKNIQKAIDVIETKMIDILSSPANSNSTEAFNMMEQEITKVLKMMNEENQNAKKIDEIEPPVRDENCLLPKKVCRKSKGILDFVPGSDLQGPVIKLENPKTIGDQSSVIGGDKKPLKDGARKSRKKVAHKTEKRSRSNSRTTNNTPKHLLSDLGESEKLLGQVDNVIQKIDNIYTKFYETKTENNGGTTTTSSPPPAPAIDPDSKVLNFLATIEKFDYEIPFTVHYVLLIGLMEVWSQAQVYDQFVIYHHIQWFHPVDEIKDSGINLDEEQENDLELMRFDLETCDNKDNNIDYDDEIETFAELRYEIALKIFYTLFFSTIFAALNFDYTC